MEMVFVACQAFLSGEGLGITIIYFLLSKILTISIKSVKMAANVLRNGGGE